MVSGAALVVATDARCVTSTLEVDVELATDVLHEGIDG